ncbi:Tetratricopeptide-like helical domain [Phytophthora cactorum]|nr:Tetratricopeptide-like helical domain [Phytophthora cactorum]
MVAGAQVMAFRRGLLPRIRSPYLAGAIVASNRDATLHVEGLHARQFAVLTSNDGQKSRQSAMQQLAEASKLSWRLRAAVENVEQSLPSDRSRRFYNRRVVEALELGDLNCAWAVVETLHRRHPDEAVLWPIYGFLINCCARKQGLVQTAERYFDELLSTGVKPMILVVNAMLRVYSRDIGRSKMMLDLVKRARDEFGLVPNTVTTRTMVYYLLCEGDVDSAVKYLRDVEKIVPPVETIRLPVKRQVLNSLVDACRQRGDWNSGEYVLSLAKRIDEEDVMVTDAERDAQNTKKLEELVANRDAFSPPVVWALDEQDWTRMTQPHQEAFFLNRSQKQSLERALERIQLHTSASRTDRSIQRQSLKLEGKLRVLDEMIRTENASANEFNAVLGACGRQGQLVDAVSVLMKMKTYAKSLPECAPTTWSYNALLNACAVRGDVHEIEAIVNKMLDNDLNPDQVTMNTVIKAHITNLKNGVSGSSQTRQNIVMQALSFFEWCTEDQKLDSGAATYYSLFRLFATYLENPGDNNATAEKDRIDDDIEEQDEDFILGQEGELVAWMSEFITTTCRDAPLASLDVGVSTTRLTFITGLFDVGLSFLDHLMTHGGYKPTLKVLSGAMQLCANSKNPDGALELFRAIETSGAFTPTVETYEPVVFAYARVGNVTSAWEIANEMEEKLGRVSISVYNRILLACVEAALPGRALEVLGIIRHKDGVAPDVISYNTALEAFVRAGERAAWWRKNNIDQREDGDADFDNDELGSDEDYHSEEAEQENGDSGQPTRSLDVAVEGTLSQEYEVEQREKAAWARASVIGLLEEMQRSRVKPDMTTYERAIAVSSVNEDSEGVITIFDRLIDRKRGKDAINLRSDLVSDSSFAAYLVACTSLQDKDRVVEASTLLHKWHAATDQVPPEFVVTQLLNSLKVLGEWRCAVRMLPDWQELFGVPPSVAVFNRVMEMCNRAGEHQLVAPIFATMQDATAYRIYPDAESYIQRIYAEEQRENWVAATDLFVEMKKRFPSEEISHQQLQKVALGRYRLRQSGH